MRAKFTPTYSLLSGLQLIVDSTGLRTGVTNEFGTVDGATNEITAVKSILPGPTGRDFTTTGVTDGRVLRTMENGIPVIEMSGTKWLRSSSSAATWNFLSYVSPFSSLKWTVTILMRCGFGSSPGDLKAFLGTNGGSQFQKGVIIYSSDQSGATNNLVHFISKGTSGTISTSSDNSVMVPNTWDVWRFTFDGSLAASLRFKAYKNGVAQTTTVTSSSTAVVTTPTNTLEIGSAGGTTGVTGPPVAFIGQMAIVVIQNVVDSSASDAFEATLTPLRAALNTGNFYAHPYNFVNGDGTRYYIGINVCQNPLTPATIVRIYREGTSHTGDLSSETKMQKSTDYGLTWAAPSVIKAAVGNVYVGGTVAGYDVNGRLWIVCEKRTFGAANELPFFCTVFYSDNDGTSWTETDITADIPSDSLPIFVFYGSMLETSTGRLGFPFYKQSTSAASSANYIMTTDDNGATWVPKTVRSSAATYINEMATIMAGDTGIVYARNDVTHEWTAFSSTDDLDTWTNDGDISLGETIVNPGPGIFSKFSLYGTNIIAFWYPDRSTTGLLKVVFGKESDLEIDSTDMDLVTTLTLRARIVHYGAMVHPYGDLYSLGAWAEDPTVNPYLNENRMLAMFGGVFMKDVLMTQFGITRP